MKSYRDLIVWQKLVEIEKMLNSLIKKLNN